MSEHCLIEHLQSIPAAGLPPPVAGDFTPNRHASQASVSFRAKFAQVLVPG